ncbi:MAG: HD domain-containing protein [Lachnospiraceae bacterium]|nr:HD domain-containing protein [Lachnospiraceae bacterium]
MTRSESKRFSKALAFAAEKHAEQRRKDKSPYILHPVKVAMFLSDNGYDLRYQIVGLFHDLLEDTDTTTDELRDFCDEEMIEAIQLVTKSADYNEKEYIEAILNNPIAKAVKNADRIDNLRDLKNQEDIEFRKRYLHDTEQYFVGKFSEELDRIWSGS